MTNKDFLHLNYTDPKRKIPMYAGLIYKDPSSEFQKEQNQKDIDFAWKAALGIFEKENKPTYLPVPEEYKKYVQQKSRADIDID